MFLCSFVIWYSYKVQAVENAKQVCDETVDVNVLFKVHSVGKVIRHLTSIRSV
jgi:hypothetical protein